jgi:hypothetical protein
MAMTNPHTFRTLLLFASFFFFHCGNGPARMETARPAETGPEAPAGTQEVAQPVARAGTDQPRGPAHPGLEKLIGHEALGRCRAFVAVMNDCYLPRLPAADREEALGELKQAIAGWQGASGAAALARASDVCQARRSELGDKLHAAGCL